MAIGTDQIVRSNWGIRRLAQGYTDTPRVRSNRLPSYWQSLALLKGPTAAWTLSRILTDVLQQRGISTRPTFRVTVAYLRLLGYRMSFTEGAGGTHLHLLHHLLAEGAHLSGAGDGHVLRVLVLACHPVEGAGVVLDVAVQVRLRKRNSTARVKPQNQRQTWPETTSHTADPN